jgi:hypothetical protein
LWSRRRKVEVLNASKMVEAGVKGVTVMFLVRNK